jgi:hypothetical protein
MFADWPGSVLNLPGFCEVLDPATGLLLFRGPRLRMGLAEGRPDRILPDHTGRASYYGHSVNCAARYMDAAAHGGQVRGWSWQCKGLQGTQSVQAMQQMQCSHV